MGSGLTIDWGAKPNALDPVTSGYQGAEEGYKLGQQGATIHALQGIDLNDPKSIDSGIGNLVHANAMEQGNALQNLAFTRYLRSQVPAVLDKIKNLGGDDATKSSDTSPSAPDHAMETFTMAKGAADKLLATPAADRPAAFAQIKQGMMQRGIPEAAIDAAGQDLTDAGLQGLSQHYGELLAHAQHQMNPQGDAPGVTPHVSNGWAFKMMGDPELQSSIGFLKGQGLDFSPMIESARSLVAPTVAKQAEIAAAPTLAGIDVAKAVATAGGTEPIDVKRAVETERGTLPYKEALSQAQADISARHELVQIPEIGADGQPTGRVTTYRKDAPLSAGGTGKPVGLAQSPSEAAGKTDDAHVFMTKYTDEANQGAIQADKNSRDQSLAAARMAQSLNPSNLTPWLAKNANTLNGLGIKIAAKDANNLSTYQTLVAQNLKSAIQVYPRNMGEFHAIQNAVADAKSPGDAAALALTETAAIHDIAAQQKQFRLDWAAQNPGKYSERDFQTAWAKQPGANQSVFASPLFRDLKINGKPAVTVYPTYKDGHTYGIFMPGTPQKTVFKVQ